MFSGFMGALLGVTCTVSSLVAQDASKTPAGAGATPGNGKMVTKPAHEADRPALGSIRAMSVTPDAKTVVVHEWAGNPAAQEDRVVEIDVATGKIQRVLVSSKGWRQKRWLQVLDAGHCALYDGVALAEYDLKSGKQSQRYKFSREKDIESFQYSADGSKVGGMTSDPGMELMDLKTGAASYMGFDYLPKHTRCQAFPLAGRQAVLVAAQKDALAGQATIQIELFDPKSSKVIRLTEFRGNLDVLPTADGKLAYVLLQEIPGDTSWTGVEVWDLDQGKQIRKIKMDSPMLTITQKLANDGFTLFLHDFMVQTVAVWDLREPAPLLGVAPDYGGCEAFDITPDGKKLVAFAGPWDEGGLHPKKLVVCDLPPAGVVKP